ncbi:M1-specific T cell receptor beta chain-like [Myxocyprinus asiaticus]|uniref:M1-specific T cell receptor beta chain-like n=1 Tax=Myxocyprinus asiaticus TaxID=70543 RepID=UPI002221E55E|nr:M1-specific T cell receptor beta chain-like [Myxocyprinus asiaticus]
MAWFFLLFTLLCLKADFSDNVLITQWPKYISTLPGSPVEMHCYQNDTDYDYKYWYRQIKGERPVLIASYIVNSPSPEKGFETGFTLTGTETKKWTLTVDVKEGSDAVYLCAASLHRNTRCANVQQKLHLLANKNNRLEIKCSLDDSGMLNMFWYQQKDTAMVLNGYNYGMSEPNYEDKYSNLKVSQPENITVTALSEKEKCKKFITLVCVVMNFYPDHLQINWKIGGKKVAAGVATDNEATKKTNGRFDMSSRLKVSKEKWNKAENIFTCIYSFYNGSEYLTDSSSVNGIKGSGFDRGFNWQVNTLKLMKSRIEEVANYAKLEFGEGTKLTVLAANISKPKVKVLPPSPREICSQNKIDKTSTLVCVATDFYPDHVHVTWQVNGKDIKTKVATDLTPQQDKSKLQYIITSRMKVDDADWMNPKNIFTCTVHFYNGKQYINVRYSIRGQKVNLRSLNTVGIGYILFLSKSVLYALIVGGLMWKLKFSINGK